MNEREPITNHRLRRGVYLLPTFLSSANLLCGYYAILATLRGGVPDLDNAARAIGFAILFDSLDGHVARWFRLTSEFGKQLDSLADVISFGVAPAFLAFSWGVRGMLGSDAALARQVYQLGWVVTFAFVICCAWRLARFNVHGMADHTSRYFVGLPTPAAAGMVAAWVHAMKTPLDDWRYALLWLLLVGSLAALMPSTMRYFSFKNIPWGRRHPSQVVLLLALLSALIIIYSEVVLLLMAASYAVSGAALHGIRFLRHHWATRAVER